MIRVTHAEARRLGIDNLDLANYRPKGKRCRGQKGADGNEGRDKAFDALCEAHGLPRPVHEFRWHPIRRWRFDYLFDFVAVERVGGIWIRGHHSRGKSQIDDMERRNEAQILGYVVLEFTPQQLDSGEAFATIKRALEGGPS